MTIAQLTDLGRKAFANQHWKDSFEYLERADKQQSLRSSDLEVLAISAYLTGHFKHCYETLTRAYNSYLQENSIQKAASCAFWMGLLLVNKGESARGGAWFGQAKNILNEQHPMCAEKGYLFLPVALRCLGQGDAEGSLQAFTQAWEIGKSFQDPDLLALAHLGQGQALIRLHKIQQGVALLDDAMVAVESGKLSPIVIGIVYCAVIETCLEIFDLSRAQEWTNALNDWCSAHPYLVPFRGQCLTRRSEIMCLHGEWTDAIKEAHHAIDLLSKPRVEPAAGTAYYQLGDIYRFQGEYEKAEKAYSEANKYGKNPQPGLALLRLAQGQIAKAKSSINNALKTVKSIKEKSDTLLANIEILLASNEVVKARSLLHELNDIAHRQQVPMLTALSAQAEAEICLAEKDAVSALEHSRKAMKTWELLKAPYAAARAHFLVAKASLHMGDEDTAGMAYEAARWRYQQLNAQPDVIKIDAYFQKRKSSAHGLTGREIQVLLLIADGQSNKKIAEALFISERTVERHVSNIFGKLGVSSRAAATAYAYKHQLL